MKLRKDKWEFVRLGDVCEKTKSVDIRKQYGSFNYIDIGSINSEMKRVSGIQELKWSAASSRARQIVKKGDTLFSTVRVNLERIAFIDYEWNDLIASTGFTIIRANEKSDGQYLFYTVSSPQFIDKLSKLQKGTAYPAVTDRIVFNEEIPLPPLEEQKQIAALFQSIETAMEQVEGQEKNLKALWKRLINEIVSDKPSFGNLLIGKKLKTYNYCDVTEKLMRKIDPLTYGIERIVAGENLESEDLKIRTWQKVGEGYLGPAFHVLFKAGDILYGSRRTYLKKVSLADFDGVCANTTYVIRAKEKLLLQDLLKHIMLSEKFTQFSIGVSKGSTNPYINWKDLDNFSFQIPDIETQKGIVKVLDSILEIIEQLKQQKATLKLLKQKLLNEILG
jgi:type I restriction enzyme S subunit